MLTQNQRRRVEKIFQPRPTLERTQVELRRLQTCAGRHVQPTRVSLGTLNRRKGGANFAAVHATGDRWKRVAEGLSQTLRDVCSHAPRLFETGPEIVNDLSVKPHAGHTKEVPAHRSTALLTTGGHAHSNSHWFPRPQLSRCANRIARQPCFFGKNIGGTGGQDGERGVARHKAI